MERYQLEMGKQDSGGFGKVIKGNDSILQRDVAVKILDPVFKAFPEKEDQERFIKEGRILASLSHPNIPAIYDIIINDEFKIIFEYIHGENLREKLKVGPISLKRARNYIIDVALALKYAHSRGVIHRDLKPENLIITKDNKTCYLVDFGIALSREDTHRITKAGYVIGTPGYMSPEQESGEDVDYKTDIYSLGICLYEMLSGKIVPKGHFDRLSDTDDLIPKAIDELILSCIKPKESRLHDLDRFVNNLVTSLRPTASIADLLTKGTLHEIVQALTQETADTFINWPVGQRSLLLERLYDLLSEGKESLAPAITSLLTELLRIGAYLRSEDYGMIVENALTYGYSKKYKTGFIGDPELREMLSDTALSITTKNYETFAKQVFQFMDNTELEPLHRWQRHDLRDLVQKAMANSNCKDEFADQFSKKLREINVLQNKTRRSQS